MLIMSQGVNQADYFDFEQSILKLDQQMDELKKVSAAKGIDYSTETRKLQQERVAQLKQLYSELDPWQIVQIARHPKRPILKDYLELMVKDFRQLHGDRNFGDDQAIITGLGQIGRKKVMLVGQNKGRTTREKVACNFGCPNPEGYRKAILKMKIAEKYNLPIVTLIDTPGAYPGIGAEERGQAQAIAHNLMQMSQIKVPIICIVIGEGGSGGALGIGVGDKLAMLEFAYYSVISPEGCAAILWRDGTKAPEAAQALKLTSSSLKQLKLVDDVIKEPLGGAHRSIHDTVYSVEKYIVKTINELRKYSPDKLIDRRYKKLRLIGSDAVNLPRANNADRIQATTTGTRKKPNSVASYH